MLRPTLALLFAIHIALAACGSFGEGQSDPGGTGTDAGTDTEGPGPMPTDAGAALPGPFCLSQDATFCRDFDTVTSPFAGWSRQLVTGGSTATLDTSSSTSTPASFHVEMPPTPAGVGSTYVYLRQEFATQKWPTVRAAFDMNFAPPAWTSDHTNVAFAALFYKTGSTTHEIYLVASDDEVQVTANLPDFTFASSPGAFPFGQWVPVSLEVRAPESGRVHVRLEIKGSTLIDRSFDVLGDLQVTELRFDIGLHNFNPPEPAFDLHYDNVVCTVE